jgi:hypothetical protein
MSHHYSGPDFGFPHGDARLDLTDLYAFPKPGDAGKSILIMNVHPSASVNPPGLTTGDPFAPEAVYELKIDTDGDAVADIAYRVRFSASEGRLSSRVRRSQSVERHGSPTRATIASLRAGEAIPSSSTRRALGTICSSPATISLPTKTCAAS